MSYELQLTLIAIGVVAIVVLATYVWRQTTVLRKERTRQQKAEAFQSKRRDHMIESIRIIAMAVEEDQVEYSEACLRLKGLLDYVAPELLDKPPYRVFQTVHEKIQHMPTHRARQATDTKFVQKMDKERYAIEHTHADEIRRAATAIRHHAFD
ncbi:MAG TPA: DUF2489 domain-containing protein [Marinobacter sp.]|nr:DUF2489 domain-containing protein [Marinobacter sp.]